MYIFSSFGPLLIAVLSRRPQRSSSDWKTSVLLHFQASTIITSSSPVGRQVMNGRDLNRGPMAQPFLG